MPLYVQILEGWGLEIQFILSELVKHFIYRLWHFRAIATLKKPCYGLNMKNNFLC